MQATAWSGPFWTVSSELLTTGGRLGQGAEDPIP